MIHNFDSEERLYLCFCLYRKVFFIYSVQVLCFKMYPLSVILFLQYQPKELLTQNFELHHIILLQSKLIMHVQMLIKNLMTDLLGRSIF